MMPALRRLLLALSCSLAGQAAHADWVPQDPSEVFAGAGAGARTFSTYLGEVIDSSGKHHPTQANGVATGSLVDTRTGKVLATAHAVASASFASKSLGVSAQGSLPFTDGSWALSTALATLHDTILFHVPFGITPVDPITVGMAVHASWSHDPAAEPSPANKTMGKASVVLRNGSGLSAADNLYIGTDTRLSNGGTVLLLADFKAAYLQTLITQYPQFTSVTATGHDVYVTLDMSLGSYGSMGRGDMLDASKTATFVGISVPQGITWSSRSGLLEVSAVPEPASWAMFTLGLAGLACRTWRRPPDRAPRGAPLPT